MIGREIDRSATSTPTVTDDMAKPVLDALVSLVGQVLTGPSRDRFAVATRLSGIGQALMREVGVARADDFEAEDGFGLANDDGGMLQRNIRLPPPLVRNLADGGVLPDNVAMMRNAYMMLAGQSAATEARQEADELLSLTDVIDRISPDDPVREVMARRRDQLVDRIRARAAEGASEAHEQTPQEHDTARDGAPPTGDDHADA